jgi:hypothetical protein
MGCTHSIDRKEQTVKGRITPVEYIQSRPLPLQPYQNEKHRLGLRGETIQVNASTKKIRDDFGI